MFSGADKDIRDHKGKKSGHYLPSNSSEEIKGLLNVHDPRLVKLVFKNVQSLIISHVFSFYILSFSL